MPGEGAPPRGIWSGTLTFGLVSIPVELHAGTRSGRPRLRMLTEDGRPVARAYFVGGREVSSEDLVRGHEAGGRYLVVTDEELEAIEPERSRDIHLRVFVARDAISPAYLRGAYLLAPSGASTRSYAALAQTMERMGRVGVATFVLRGREQLVAVMAEGGVLRALRLRFADELRSRSRVGLPEAQEVPDDRLEAMLRAVRAAELDAVPSDLLEDERAARVEALAGAKLERGEDVVEVEEREQAEAPAEEPPDVVAILKQRLARAQPLEDRSREELYARAQALGIEGRSKMNKTELIESIRAAEAA